MSIEEINEELEDLYEIMTETKQRMDYLLIEMEKLTNTTLTRTQ